MKVESVSSLLAGMKFQVPSPLSSRDPLPLAIVRSFAVRASFSMSVALASSSACVIRRIPLSSAIGVSTTGVVCGVSLTGVMSSVAVPAMLSVPSVTL